MPNKIITLIVTLGLITSYSIGAHSQILVADPISTDDPIDLGDEQNPDDPH